MNMIVSMSCEKPSSQMAIAGAGLTGANCARALARADLTAHARSGWSRPHPQQPPDGVQDQRQGVLRGWLGHAVERRYSAVRRWRQAALQPMGTAPVLQPNAE
jgi:predicted NAD/FAD-dependent oxidoreductase